MNSEELHDQVFELIEHAAFDPEGVNDMLAPHPEFRADFDRLKAALVLAEQLPLEEPPVGIDATILEAAAHRHEPR
jgi:hypothetical protein